LSKYIRIFLDGVVMRKGKQTISLAYANIQNAKMSGGLLSAFLFRIDVAAGTSLASWLLINKGALQAKSTLVAFQGDRSIFPGRICPGRA
jgi:hypothetical protein